MHVQFVLCKAVKIETPPTKCAIRYNILCLLSLNTVEVRMTTYNRALTPTDNSSPTPFWLRKQPYKS